MIGSKDPPLIGAAMTASPVAVAVSAPLLEARRLMIDYRIHHLPVLEGEELRGIISDRDIKLVLGPEFDYPNPRELTVEDAYSPNTYAVDLATPVGEVAATMAARHIGAAVITEGGRLAGIFTATDACRFLGEWLRQSFPA